MKSIESKKEYPYQDWILNYPKTFRYLSYFSKIFFYKYSTLLKWVYLHFVVKKKTAVQKWIKRISNYLLKSLWLELKTWNLQEQNSNEKYLYSIYNQFEMEFLIFGVEF